MWRQCPSAWVQWQSLEDSVEGGCIVKPRIPDLSRSRDQVSSGPALRGLRVRLDQQVPWGCSTTRPLYTVPGC